MRVAYVTQWFPPEPDGPSLWVSQSMCELGFEVHVVTAIPNYPLGVVYEGYSSTRVRREIVDGIHVTRCPIYPSHDRSALRRVLNYASFASTASWIGRRILQSADVSLVYSSPETAAIPATISQMRNGTPYVLLIQDLWPETVLQTGFLNSSAMRGIAQVALGAMDRLVCNRAEHIIVIAQGMKEVLVNRGVPEEKISVMFNWVDESIVFPRARTGELRRKLGIPGGDLLFTFAGNHGSAQGLAAWIEALGNLRDLTDLHFAFIGEGTAKQDLIARSSELGLQHIHFLESVSLQEFVQLASDADAQIVSLSDSPLFRITIPGKVQSCLALGAPILGSIAGDAAQVISESQAGFLATPGNSEEIEMMIRQAYSLGQKGLEKVGEVGRTYYLDHMSSEKGSKVLGDVLRAAAKSGSSRRG